MMSRLYVLCDIDHTLSDASWRDPMLEGAERWSGWDAYHSQSVHDDQIEEMIHLVNGLAVMGLYVVVMTARPSKFYQMTMDWLLRHRVTVDELLMRQDEDFRPSPEIKIGLARERFSNLDEIAIVIDDREDVCEIFRAAGVTTLQATARRR